VRADDFMKLSMFKYITGFLVFLLWFPGCRNDVNDYIYIIPGDSGQKLVSQYLTAENIPITDEQAVLKIEKNSRNLKALMGLLSVLQKQLDVTINNINNINTTKTADGSYFRRHSLKISEQGKIDILTDDVSQPRLVYDPAHPDAIKTGIKKGYVEYPNIDRKKEFYEYSCYISLYNSIVEVLRKNNIYIIYTKMKLWDFKEDK
jgi:flagellar basal-body rod protein FlgC